MMNQTTQQTLRIGHSPDPDDAFMWYPLADVDGGPKIDTGPYRFEHVLEDIESLNHRAERGELEITALSIHQYAFVANQYMLTSCGSSMGDGYGPMIVAREKLALRDLITPVDTPAPNKRNRPTIAIPGTRTTAALALNLLLAEQGVAPGADRTVNHEVVPFDRIIDSVVAGEYDAGLIIHEGQLTFEQAGLTCVADLGQWWTETRKLPLPLGGNAIRRDLADQAPAICDILLQSIRWALANRKPCVDYALNYARDMGADLADRFVGMYVNDWTLDYGRRGRQAVQRLLDEAAEAHLCPRLGAIDFVEPAGA